jgi:hypothetical protein
MLSGPLGALSVPAVWLAGFLIFQRYRRGTTGFAERTVNKSRLPSWVRQVEFYVFAALFVGLFLLLFTGLFGLHRTFHPANRASDLAMVLIVMSSGIGALVPAMLIANLISWFVPSLRRANEIAMSGLPTTSFQGANKGLLAFGAVVVPLCVAQGILGAIEPWVR